MLSIITFCMTILLLVSISQVQTKNLKRPKKPIGIFSVNTFVSESFDIYEKAYKYEWDENKNGCYQYFFI